MFGTAPRVPQPLDQNVKSVSNWMVDLQHIREDLDWLINAFAKEEIDYTTGAYHLNNVRMLVGFVLREIKGGDTPYRPLEIQRSHGNTTDVAEPADTFDREGYVLPDDPLQRLDYYRRLLQAFILTLKVLRERYYLIDRECALFFERAVIECELSRAWIGFTGYPTFRNGESTTA